MSSERETATKASKEDDSSSVATQRDEYRESFSNIRKPNLVLRRKVHGEDTTEYTVSVDVKAMSPLIRALIPFVNLDAKILFLSVIFSGLFQLSFVTTITILLPGLFLLALRIRYGPVESESLMTVEEIGIQLSTVYFDGRTESKFVDIDTIESIVINEGITLCRVVFYMAFIVKFDDKMTLAFENLRPRRRALTKIFRGTRAAMFGSAENAARSRSSRRKRSSRSRRDRKQARELPA